jgi:hypothetical protein
MLYSLKKYLPVLIIIVLTGCGIAPRLTELRVDAETAFENEDYTAALQSYEELIELQKSRNREIRGDTWHHAGIAAWETDKKDKAIEYLVQAGRKDYSTESSLYILSNAYREIDNLSLEITNLEKYIANYPEGEYIDEMQKYLFDAYIESKNFDAATDLWTDLESQAEDDPEIMESYLVLTKNQGRDEDARKVSEKIIKMDRNNTLALEFLGEYYFWKAENRYQEEMKAYEANRTTRQYRHLLTALDEINKEFRLSRDYFLRLWNQNPESRYATYLRNIHLRFGDDERAGYYQKRIN